MQGLSYDGQVDPSAVVVFDRLRHDRLRRRLRLQARPFVCMVLRMHSPALTVGTAPRSSSAYRTYILLLLTAVYTFNFIDRQIIAILSRAIQDDLKLNDAQMGLLIGPAFAVLYGTLGLPTARLADRANRVWVITIALASWSGFTALSAYAQNFVHLTLARIGVGIGEAGGSPPAHSLISDLYPKEQRAFALGVYALGIPIGVTLAYLGGAWILTTLGWRMTLIAVGLPGIALAVLVRLTIREPQRGASETRVLADAFTAATASEPSTSFFGTLGREIVTLWRVAVHLLKIPTYRGIVFGLTAGSFASYSIGAWIVQFFQRVHPEYGLGKTLLGLGIIAGTAYVFGVFIGGALVDYRAKTSRAAYGYIPALALTISIPCFLGAVWVDSPVLSLVLWWPTYLLTGFYLGPCFAMAQTLAPVSTRALSTGIFFFILNVIALGGGPTLVGVLSEVLKPVLHPDNAEALGLQIALSTSVVALLISIGFFVWTAPKVERDWAAATGESPPAR